VRRITLWVVSTVAALVLLFSYRTSTMGAGAATSGGMADNRPGIVSGPPPAGPTDTGSGDTGSGDTGATGTPGSGAAASPKTGSGTLVVNGTVADTRYGPVQVQIRVTSGKITDIVALQLPSGDSRDEEINSYAVPQLREEVLTAQSARIDTVSGATYTSEGYRQSLQAALDAAHIR
jgi:uncharacterized protein with FMN-binding domain